MSSIQELKTALEEHFNKSEPSVMTRKILEDEEDLSEFHPSWIDVNGTTPCGSLFPGDEYLQTVNHGPTANKRDFDFPEVGIVNRDVIGDELSEALLTSWLKRYDKDDLDREYAFDALKTGLVQFLVDLTKPRNDPSAVFGFVALYGLYPCVAGDRKIEIVINVALVCVNPDYQGIGVGPLLCGALGYQIGETIHEFFRLNPLSFLDFDEMEVTVEFESGKDAGIRCAEAILDVVEFLADLPLILDDVTQDLSQEMLLKVKDLNPRMHLQLINEH